MSQVVPLPGASAGLELVFAKQHGPGVASLLGARELEVPYLALEHIPKPVLDAATKILPIRLAYLDPPVTRLPKGDFNSVLAVLPLVGVRVVAALNLRAVKGNASPLWHGGVDLHLRTVCVDLEVLLEERDTPDLEKVCFLLHESAHVLAGNFVEEDCCLAEILLTLCIFGEEPVFFSMVLRLAEEANDTHLTWLSGRIAYLLWGGHEVPDELWMRLSDRYERLRRVKSETHVTDAIADV